MTRLPLNDEIEANGKKGIITNHHQVLQVFRRQVGDQAQLHVAELQQLLVPLQQLHVPQRKVHLQLVLLQGPRQGNHAVGKGKEGRGEGGGGEHTAHIF